MRVLGKLIVVAAASWTLVGCGAKMGQDEWAGLVHPNVLAKQGLQYYWRLSIELDRDETIVRMYLLDENLYCLTNRNRLVAVDAAVGNVKWLRSVADPEQTVFRPCHADGVLLSQKVSGIAEITGTAKPVLLKAFDAVIINSLSEVLVLNRATGEVVRNIALDFAANTGGSSDGVFFYVGSTKGWYHAIRLQEATEAWRKSTGDLLSAPVEYFGGRVYIGGEDGYFSAAKIGERGRKLWRQPLDGAVMASFHVDGRGCFVPCEDNRVYAFDVLDGKKLWAPFICQGPARSPIQVGENTVFQYATGDKLYAINLVTGKQRWALPQGRQVLAVMEGEVYLRDNLNHLRIIDEILGTEKGRLPLTGLDLFASSADGAAIYAATRCGRVFCIRLETAGHLTPAMLKKLQP